MFTAPDEHMPYIIQLHIMSIQQANKAAEHLIKGREGGGGERGERETERETERNRARQRDRETETERQRQRDRQRETENSNSKTLFSKDCSLASFRPA